MENILKQERKLLGLALALHVLGAWFSVGWQHPDEHYQIIEFARYLLGDISSDGLPWEFGAGMRPTFQVYLAAIVIRSSDFLGFTDPFFQSFLFRAFMGSASVLALWSFHNRLKWENPDQRRLHFFLCFFSWALVYVHFRFSSETLSAFFLVLASSFWFRKENYKSLILCGMMLGFSFISRFQTGFFIAGMGIAAFILEPKYRFSICLLLAAGFIPVLLFGAFLDIQFYNKILFTPWNYLDQNIFKNVAASFGVEPWYWYILQGFEKLIPPFSLLILPGFFLLANPKKLPVLGWACLAFLVGHFGIGHKEWRFLFPLAGFVPLAVVYTWTWLQMYSTQIWSKKLLTFLGRAFIGVNGVVLLFILFRPASEMANVYQVLFREIKGPAYLMYEKTDPYMTGPNEAGFYLNKNLIRLHYSSLDTLKNQAKLPVYLYTQSGKTSELFSQKNFNVLYSSFPDWIYSVNINHWVDRSPWYKIYKIER
jgi:phosphatidylinositol glycan class B